MKKYDDSIFIFLILKNRKIVRITHHPTQSNPEINGFIQPDPML
jgi:hypothetical protein